MGLRPYSYEYVPTLGRMAADNAPQRAVTGPVGSGKTVACAVIEVYSRSLLQLPGRDGVRRTRWAIVRNTSPQLRRTVIKSFFEWIPKDDFGEYTETPYARYIMNKVDTPDGIPVESEIWFVALDKEDQLRDLLSMELTGCVFSEAREIGKLMFNLMKTRINRYPPRESDGTGGATWSGITIETNPCDTDHWVYQYFVIEKPTRCSQCIDPITKGWVLLPSRDPVYDQIIPFDQRFCPLCGQDYIHSIPITSLYRQPSARSPQAENIPHLDPNYYPISMAGQTQDFIKVFIDAEWGYVGEGKKVYPDWVSKLFVVKKEIPVIKQLPLVIGMDFWLNPAAVICQYQEGKWFHVIDEVVGKDIVLREFLEKKIIPHLQSKYLGMERVIFGDPSGIQRMGTDGNTFFKELAAHKLHGTPVSTNSIPARITAVTSLLNMKKENIAMASEPIYKMPFQVAEKCVTLIKGFDGAYHYKRVAITGKEIFRDEPEKTFESHVHDALQYATLGCESGLVKVGTYSRGARPQQTAPPVGAYT